MPRSASTPQKPHAEKVLKELPPVGKYRVRVIEGKVGPILDIREYVSTDTFEGFTRRGIRLSVRAEIDQLRETLSEFLKG